MTQRLVVATVALAILNGIFSPWLLLVFLFYPLWYPNWAPVDAQVVVMLASLILSTLTLMAAGVPAALYERYRGSGPTDSTSAAIWLAGAALLTVPAIPGLLRALGMG